MLSRAGKIGPDGKLRILHNIDKPSTVSENCLPYAAWHLLSAGSSEG